MNLSPVSVCLPIYNGEQFLRECIDSILSQTHENFELLIVDDCSRDNSANIVADYVSRDRRIRYEKNERNLGLVGNWNRCVRLAKYDWIKFVFQDDLISSNCLERMLVHAGDAPKLITCRRDFLFDDSVDSTKKNLYDSNRRLIESIFATNSLDAESCKANALRYFGINIYGEPTCVLLHREFFEQFGLFQESLAMICDTEYWTRVSIHTGAQYIPETLATFRVHVNAVSAQNFALRQFRTFMLDPLLLWHDFARLPVYKPLRDYAASRAVPIGIEASLQNHANFVYEVASQARRFGDDKLMKELKNLTAQAPDLATRPVNYFLWKIKRNYWEFRKRSGDHQTLDNKDG